MTQQPVGDLTQAFEEVDHGVETPAAFLTLGASADRQQFPAS